MFEALNLDGLDTVTNSEGGVEMVVTKADGSGDPVLMANQQPLKLILLGPDSKKYRQAFRTNTEKRIARSQAARNKRVDGGQEFDLAEQESFDIVTGCTIGWNLVDASLNAVTFTPNAIREFYRRFPAARDQADVFIANRANFLSSSAPSLSSSPALTSDPISQ